MRLLLLLCLCAYAASASGDLEYDDYDTVSPLLRQTSAERSAGF